MFYPEVGEVNMHAQTVCTRPSPPPILEGLGTRLCVVHVQQSEIVGSSKIWNRTEWNGMKRNRTNRIFEHSRSLLRPWYNLLSA